ncbi:cytochrome P450 [Apodospora peruviana]|uniref:Cytochrome P450 n=1 Tax=Apodospora peruviana TaxID=516989 RepID=A0AAE0ICI2_9PEZI|nr:cytochrome P450 [Apodospora peruviana]
MAVLEALYEKVDVPAVVRFMLYLMPNINTDHPPDHGLRHTTPPFPPTSQVPRAMDKRPLRSPAGHCDFARQTACLLQEVASEIRVSPNELIFCRANAWDDIYGNKPGKPDMEKSPLQAGGMPPNVPARALTLAPWDDHVRQRKAWAYPFSNTALLGQEPLVQVYISKLISCLDKLVSQGKAVNMAAWMTYTTFDIIGELCFAEPFGCLESGEQTDWSQDIIKIANAGMYEQASRRIAGVGTWMQGVLVKWLMPGEVWVERQQHFVKSREKTMRRIKDEGREHKDFIYYVLRNAESKAMLSELEIVMNTALFIGAGSDTTALMLTAWANLMLRNRSSYQKLVDEIRGAIRSVDDITFATVRDLEYLGAVISESFRMCAPVPTNLCRVVPAGGAQIDGNWVPKGTTVSVSPWAATHLPLNWDRPLEFIPERWLEGEQQRFPHDKRQASQPFSYGPRGCIGKNLANIEQKLIIANLLFHFDMDAAEGKEEQVANERWRLDGDMAGLTAMLVWEKQPLWVRLSKRVIG